MRKVLIILVILIALALVFLYFYNSLEASVGTINIFLGNAEVKRGDETLSANSGFKVKEKDLIKTHDNTRISILLEDRSVIRLEENSEVAVDRLKYQKNGKIDEATFRLISGNIWSRVEPLDSQSDWSVETPTSVASVRGTQFNSMYLNLISGYLVYTGKVGVVLKDSADKEVLIQAGNKILLRDSNLLSDFQNGPTTLENDDYNDWIIFNIREDAKIDNEEFLDPTSVNPEEEEVKVLPTVSDTENKTAAPKSVNEKKLLSLVLYGNKSNILVGEETRLKVQAKYSDQSNIDVPFKDIVWSKSSNLGNITDPGYYSSSKAGSVVISAKFQNISSNDVSINIKESMKVLKRVEVTYVKNQSFSQTNYSYPQVQFTATAIYDVGPNENITSKCDWSVLGSASGSMNSDGLYTPETRGSATVDSLCEGENDSVTIDIP